MERLAGRIILLWGWRRVLVALLAGAFAALAQAPFDFFAAAFVSFPLLVWLLDGASPRPGSGLLRRLGAPFMVGWWFGFGYFVAGLWWVGNALLVEADLFAWALPFAVVGLPALLAVFYGLATALARLVWSDGAGRIAALAVAFGLSEWLRSFVLTGFPWNAVGLAAMPVPAMMQSVHVVGMIGMNALAVFVFAMPAVLAAPRGRLAGLAAATLVAALHCGYGTWRLATAEAEPATLIRARIVQPSVDQGEKWDPQVRDRIFATYLELSGRPAEPDRAAPALIVWPETALPFLLTDRPDALTALGRLVEDGQMLLAGAVRVEGDTASGNVRYTNALIAVDPSGTIVDATDKLHLVPFGEYLPFAEILGRIGMTQLVEAASPFSAGSQRRPMDAGNGVSVLAYICYEIIFPGVAGFGDAPADLIVNVTNDAWFGDTAGPYQHFRQAQIRAVEAGRPLLRAANNGISGVVDAYGRVVDAYAVDAVGALDVDVPRQRLDTGVLAGPDINGAAILGLLFMVALAGRARGLIRSN